MASIKGRSVLQGMRGQLGKQIVIKHYGARTVVTAYPDMNHIKPSKKQKKQRSLFAEAVAYARNINSDPAKKKVYLLKIKPGKSVYHYALQEYLSKERETAFRP